MTDVTNDEQEFPMQGCTRREEMMASTAVVTTCTLEIPYNNAAFWEMTVEEIQDLTSPLREVIAEIFQSLQFLASEDYPAMLFSPCFGPAPPTQPVIGGRGYRWMLRHAPAILISNTKLFLA